MIVFDLSCDKGHCFEGWFRNSEEYTAQLESGLLSCPSCGSEEIIKKASPSRINLGKQQQLTQLSSLQHDAQNLANKINEYIKTNFEDVGSQFADQALKMHYGELEERNIKGTATMQEAINLKEEGVDIIPLPEKSKNKLN